MQHLVLGWVFRKEFEDLSLTNDWVWSHTRLIVELTICMLVINICTCCVVYIDLIPIIMDDSNLHLGVRSTLIRWHLQIITAEVNWLQVKWEFCRRTDVASADLASDKAGSRALVDLVRYNFSGGCEIYLMYQAFNILYSKPHLTVETIWIFHGLSASGKLRGNMVHESNHRS